MERELDAKEKKQQQQQSCTQSILVENEHQPERVYCCCCCSMCMCGCVLFLFWSGVFWIVSTARLLILVLFLLSVCSKFKFQHTSTQQHYFCIRFSSLMHSIQMIHCALSLSYRLCSFHLPFALSSSNEMRFFRIQLNYGFAFWIRGRKNMVISKIFIQEIRFPFEICAWW